MFATSSALGLARKGSLNRTHFFYESDEVSVVCKFMWVYMCVAVTWYFLLLVDGVANSEKSYV